MSVFTDDDLKRLQIMAERTNSDFNEVMSELSELVEKTNMPVIIQQWKMFRVYAGNCNLKISELESSLKKCRQALEGMVEQFGFHRVHEGLVNDERQAILDAQEALSQLPEGK